MLTSNYNPPYKTFTEKVKNTSSIWATFAFIFPEREYQWAVKWPKIRQQKGKEDITGLCITHSGKSAPEWLSVEELLWGKADFKISFYDYGIVL